MVMIMGYAIIAVPTGIVTAEMMKPSSGGIHRFVPTACTTNMTMMPVLQKMWYPVASVNREK
jgi:hypothetical protein